MNTQSIGLIKNKTPQYTKVDISEMDIYDVDLERAYLYTGIRLISLSLHI